jgi:dynein heavy chain
VQKHINKCFEAINLLEFNPNQEVVAMISGEKEKVKFNKSINVNEGEKKGNVERWLSEIEGVMIDTLRKIMRDSLFDQQKRTTWVRAWPAQIILGVNMIRWTKGSEKAIMTGKGDIDTDEKHPEYNNLENYLQHLITDLKDIVELVRQDLNSLERLTLGALVVLDVHARDVIRQLVREKCASTHEFSWIA